MIVVSDATTLSGLAKIEHLHLLPALFNVIYLPNAVHTEVTVLGAGLPGAQELAEADWLRRRPIQDRLHVDYLRSDLDAGEAEALVLAQELRADYLIVDEQRTRTVAYLLRIPHIGTIGILQLAKRTGLNRISCG